MHCTLIAFVVGEDLDQALTLEYLLGPIVPLNIVLEFPNFYK